MTTLEAMRQALRALDEVNEHDMGKQLLPTPLWHNVMGARGVLIAAIAREEVAAAKEAA